MSEVYIDGVNVAECEFYDRCNYTTCMIGIQDYIDCDKNPNCMFKQLQRAKAENERLKEELELNTANAVVIDMTERLYKYKQALEEIRDLNNKTVKIPIITEKINEVLNEG